jgi:protein TonB
MKLPLFPQLGKLTVATCLAGAIAGTSVQAMGDVQLSSTSLPQAVFQPSPKYSLPMRYDQVHGAVKVSFLVDSRGKVSDPIVLRADDGRMADAALAAVRAWTFRPAVRNGEPVNCRVVQTINFPVFDPANADR